MSYSRTYRETITVPYSGSLNLNFPPSENGGSETVYYSGTVDEDVYVNIDVDTNPFDNSVAHCNSSVNLLTGAVVATEAAHTTHVAVWTRRPYQSNITRNRFAALKNILALVVEKVYHKS